MKRLALMLLALFMVPVVIVATPAVANAATKYSGTVAAGFRHDSWVPGEWADCSFTAFYAVTGSATDGYTQTVKTKNGDCSTGANFNLEGAAVTLQYNGMTGTGVECAGSASFALGTDEVMPNSSASMTLFPGAASALCEVQELCWSFSKSQTWGNDHSGSGCEPLTMGTPGVPGSALPTGCNAGNVTAPPSVTVGDDPEFGAPWKRLTVTIPFDSNASEQFMANWLPTNGGSPTDQAQWAAFTNTPGTTPATSELVFFFRQYNADTNWMQPRGVQLWQYSNRVIPTNVAAMEEGGANFNMGSHVGFTQATACVWYFGPKIRSTATNELDEPAAPLSGEPAAVEPDPVNAAPAGKPEACTFSLTDPTTWLEGGMCAAVGLLGAIWNTLGDVVSAVIGIPAAILDGLSGLFVPDDGYLNAKTSQLKTSWNNTQPGAWTGAVTDQAWDLPAGGCSGVPLNFDLPGGVQVDEHLGEACTGTMATVAATTKLAASAILVIFGALACLRALGSGFGWNPSIGRGESA